MRPLIELNSLRAKQARLAKTIGRGGYLSLSVFGGIFLLGSVAADFVSGVRFGLILLAPVLLCWLPAIWWKRYLSVLPPSGQDITGRLSLDVLARLKPGTALQPRAVWDALSDHWQAAFFTNHLLLNKDIVRDCLEQDEGQLQQALQLADQFARQNNSPVIELGFVAAGLMQSAPRMQQLLVKLKGRPADIQSMADWLGRNLGERRKRNFGGIGRDWAFGFTPLLDRFGRNISLSIAKYGAHFDYLTTSDGVKAIEAAFANHANAVILVGPDGIGKTNSIYALAQKLIEGETVRELAYHQIVELNATDITSRARRPGDLEQIMISLANEAAHAGHVILFLDDAQLF